MTASSTTRTERWIALLCSLALAIAFLAPGLPPGRAPVSTDPLYADGAVVPFADVRPPDYQASNPYLSDQALVFYPWLTFMSRAVRGGELPLWTPHSGGGLPFMGNLSSALFFPTTWLCFLPPEWVSVARGMTLGAIVRLFLAGFFGYLLLRRLSLGRVAAATGALVLMAFGYQFVWLFYSLSNVASVIPLCLYLAVRFADRPTRGNGLLFALGMALQFLGGHAETSVALAIAATALYLAVSREHGQSLLAATARFGLVGLVALLLGAFQIAPFVEYLMRSWGQVERIETVRPAAELIRAASPHGLLRATMAVAAFWIAAVLLRRDRGPGRSVAAAVAAGISVALAVRLLVPLGLSSRPLLLLDPDLFGNPLRDGYRSFEAYTDVNGGYVGWAALLLSVVAALVGRRPALRVAAASLVLFALVLFGAVEPFYSLLKSMPPFDLAADTRMLPLCGVGFGVLAALAVDDLCAGLVSRYLRALLRVLVCVAVAWGVVVSTGDDRDAAPAPSVASADIKVVAPGPGAALSPQIDARGRGKLTIDVAGEVKRHPGSEVVVELGGAMVARERVDDDGRFAARFNAHHVPEGRYRLRVDVRAPDGTSLGDTTSYLTIDRHATLTRAGTLRGCSAAAVLLAVLLAMGRGSRRAWVAVVPALVLAELAWFGARYNVFVPEEQVFPRTQLTDFLADESQRWRRDGEGPFRVLAEDLILQPNMHYVYDLQVVRAYDQLELARFQRLMMELVQGGSLARVNHRTIDFRGPLFSLLNLSYVVTASDLGELDGFELVHESSGGRVYRSVGAMPRAFLVSRAVDQRRYSRAELFALGLTETAYLEETPPAPLGGRGTVEFEVYGLNRVRLRARTDGPALLVLTDNDYPGWKATVDGERVPIYRTHNTFRSVLVPAGESVVEFRYRPSSFFGGGIIAIVALSICLAFCLFGRFGPRFASETS